MVVVVVVMVVMVMVMVVVMVMVMVVVVMVMVMVMVTAICSSSTCYGCDTSGQRSASIRTHPTSCHNDKRSRGSGGCIRLDVRRWCKGVA